VNGSPTAKRLPIAPEAYSWSSSSSVDTDDSEISNSSSHVYLGQEYQGVGALKPYDTPQGFCGVKTQVTQPFGHVAEMRLLTASMLIERSNDSSESFYTPCDASSTQEMPGSTSSSFSILAPVPRRLTSFSSPGEIEPSRIIPMIYYSTDQYEEETTWDGYDGSQQSLVPGFQHIDSSCWSNSSAGIYDDPDEPVFALTKSIKIGFKAIRVWETQDILPPPSFAPCPAEYVENMTSTLDLGYSTHCGESMDALRDVLAAIDIRATSIIPRF
jgi:hypothetical protein